MIKKLTALNVPTLKPGQYVDQNLPALNIRVGVKGGTWILRTRDKLGKQVALKLGHTTSMGLSEARDAAREAKKKIEAGEMPNAARKVEAPQLLTLGQLVDQYEAYRRMKGTRIKSLTANLKVVRNKLGKHLGYPAAQFTEDDVLAIRDALLKTAPVQSNRFLAYLRPILQFGYEDRKVPVNSVREVKKRGPERKVDRFLADKEIAKLWKATDTAEPFHRLVRFMLLTGCRREEGAIMRFGDITDGVWFQADNKSSRPVKHKISRAALDVVGTGEKGEMVFPCRVAGHPMSGWSKFKPKLDKVSGVTGWTLRDLRRTMATHMQAMEINPQIIGMCQNHKLQGMAAHYQHAEMIEAKHAAWEKWSDKINSLVDTGGLRGQSAESSR